MFKYVGAEKLSPSLQVWIAGPKFEARRHQNRPKDEDERRNYEAMEEELLPMQSDAPFPYLTAPSLYIRFQ